MDKAGHTMEAGHIALETDIIEANTKFYNEGPSKVRAQLVAEAAYPNRLYHENVRRELLAMWRNAFLDYPQVFDELEKLKL